MNSRDSPFFDRMPGTGESRRSQFFFAGMAPLRDNLYFTPLRERSLPSLPGKVVKEIPACSPCVFPRGVRLTT